MDSPRYFSNFIFPDLKLLSERLEQLGIDQIMDKNESSDSPAVDNKTKSVESQISRKAGRHV